MRDLGHHLHDDEPDPGGRPIETNQRRADRAAPVGPAAALAGLVLSFAAAGILGAPAATAVDDAVLPDARVAPATSCLGSTAQDGSGTGLVDELDDSLDRPATEDCDAAVTAPPPSPPSSPTEAPTSSPIEAPTASPTPAPTSPPSAVPTPTTTAAPSPGPTSPTEPSGTPSPSSPQPTPAPAPPGPPAAPTPSATAEASAAPAPTTSSRRPAQPSAAPPRPAPVQAGDSVRVRVPGYLPGEQVTIALSGSGEVLGSATAAGDGAVVADVLIPASTESGPASLDVVGSRSVAVADVPLEVAGTVFTPSGARESVVPLLVAGGALAATATGLLSTAFRRRPGRG